MFGRRRNSLRLTVETSAIGEVSGVGAGERPGVRKRAGARGGPRRVAMPTGLEQNNCADNDKHGCNHRADNPRDD